MAVTYRRAKPEDADAIGKFLSAEMTKQTDLLVEKVLPPLEMAAAFKEILACPTEVCQIGEEGGKIVALAHGTTGIERDEGGWTMVAGAEIRDVRFIVCNLIITAGWTTQKQRLARLAALVVWCLNDDATMGIERVKTGPLKTGCMGAQWMTTVVKWQGQASSDASTLDFKGELTDMKARLTP